MKCEHCTLGLNRRILYMKNQVLDGKFHFHIFFTALAKAYETVMHNSFSDDKHLPQSAKPHSGASPPPPRSHTTLQV